MSISFRKAFKLMDQSFFMNSNSSASMTDAEFRQLLLNDARKAMSELAGRELPEGFNIKFIEKDANYQGTFVLPDFISDELDTRDLCSISC